MNKSVSKIDMFKRLLLSLCFVMVAVFVMRSENVYAEIASGTAGTCPWVIDDDGVLTISAGTLPSSSSGSVSAGPWYSVRTRVKQIVIESGVKTSAGCNYLFSGMTNLTDIIGLSNLDTSDATRMYGMFYNCSRLTSLDLSNFNTRNVTSMGHMFRDCIQLENLSFSSFSTGNVTNMSCMFYNCSHLTNLDLSNFNTGQVTNMSYMFYSCYGLTSLDLSDFDTGQVTSMEYMFNSCSRLTSLNLLNFNTSVVTTMNYMFSGCSNIQEIILGPNFSFNANGTSAYAVLPTIAATEKITGKWIREDGVYGPYTSDELRDNYTSAMAGKWVLEKQPPAGYAMLQADGELIFFRAESGLAGGADKTVTDVDGNEYTGQLYTGIETSIGPYNLWSRQRPSIKSFRVADGQEVKLLTCAYLFSDCTNLTDVNLEGLDTSDVTSMGGMFSRCSKLTGVDLSPLNTGNVRDINNLFNQCTSLTNVDLSVLDTHNVSIMNDIFYGCHALTNVDLTNFDTSAATTMKNMFLYCSSLTSLDLSSFDTNNVTTMSSMFSSCSRLSEVTLGPDFSFKGNNIASTSNQAILPTPLASLDGISYTRKWVLDDKSQPSITSAELRDNYDGSIMSGTWIWELDEDSSVVNFDATGGYCDPQRVVQNINGDSFELVTFPEATRPGYQLTGWNTAKDGSGTTYAAGDTYTPVGGETKTFYAQWKVMAGYTVNYYQQNTSLDGYDLVKTETGMVDEGSSFTAPLEEYDGFITPTEQSSSGWTGDKTFNYYYDRTQYTIHFDGNGADSGSVPDQQMVGAITARLNDNRFKKTNSWFAGWNTQADGSGTSYGDAQTMVNAAENGETKTLYAQWVSLDGSSYESSSGEYVVYVKAGGQITIPNLPAGTHYTITEVDNPGGWTQDGAVGTEGTIEANVTSSGTIHNSYSASGSIRLYAYKTMDVGDLNPGDFSFELSDESGVLQTVANGGLDEEEEILAPNGEDTIKNPYYGMSKIVFDDITYTEAGTHHYTIREVQAGEEGIEYDGHVEEITVDVSDNHDGTLTCVATYDSDGPIFTNSRIPVFDNPGVKGRLFVSKEVSNDGNADDVFNFKVTFADASGTPLTEEYPYDVVKTEGRDKYKSPVKRTVSAVSHTENISDYGVQSGSYGDNWSNGNIRGTGRAEADVEAHVVTIEGAENLHVSIMYGTEASNYDWVCMWQGAHPNYTADGNFGSSVTGKLGGGNHTASANTREYDIPGDTVTFSFNSDGSSGTDGDDYGYYAVVSGEVNDYEYDDRYYLSSGKVSSGMTVSGKAGETVVIEGLPDGAVYSVEELPSSGYELVDSQGTQGSISAEADTEAKFTNVYSAEGSMQFELEKNLVGGTLTGGAFTFNLADADGNVLQTVTNNDEGKIVFEPIKLLPDDVGKRLVYYVTEVNDGDANILYDTNTLQIIASVSGNEDGELEAEVSYPAGTTFVNRVTKGVVISKQDINGDEIPGATLKITGRADGASEDIEPIQWVSETAPHTVNLAPGTYVLHEEAVPESGLYIQASDITFSVDADGVVTVQDEVVDSVVMVDEYSFVDVVISKQDINGDEIEGAQLEITGTETASGEEITPITWTSVAGENKTVQLKPGTYTLHESAVPESGLYVLASDIDFTVEADGTVKVGSDEVDMVVMTDRYAPRDVSISKLGPSGDLLANAVLKVMRGETVVETWTSEDEAHVVSLDAGDYTLVETNAPAGYTVADPVAFTVTTDRRIKIGNAFVDEVTMTDAYDETGLLKVTKKVEGEKVDATRVFDFIVTIHDTAGDLNTSAWKVNNEAVEVTKKSVSGGYDYTFHVSLKHNEAAEITGLHVGSTYTVAETDESARGYSSVATGQTGTIAATVQTAAFTNYYTGELPATGFFGMDGRTRNMILAAVVLMVLAFAAFYNPKKREEK